LKLLSVGGISALIYGGVTLFIAGIFFVVTVAGDYTWVTRIGGTLWVALLSLVIFMPLATSQVKKRFRS
jgi:hypothetical protein